MKKVLNYGTSDDPEQANMMFQVNITELIQLTESCNNNTDKLWQRLTKFMPKAKPHNYMQHYIKTVAAATDTYTLYRGKGDYVGLSLTKWASPKKYPEIMEIAQYLDQINSVSSTRMPEGIMAPEYFNDYIGNISDLGPLQAP